MTGVTVIFTMIDRSRICRWWENKIEWQIWWCRLCCTVKMILKYRGLALLAQWRDHDAILNTDVTWIHC